MADNAVNPVQGLKPPQPLTLGNNPMENWKLFKQRWQTYSLLASLDQRPNRYQVAMFTHTLSDEALKIYNGFEFAGDENNRTVAEIITKFDEFAIGQINVTYERFLFHKRIQEAEEPFETFYSDLRSLSKTCAFCDACIPSMIRDRIVLGIRDVKVQTDLLKVRDLTLDQCVDICRAAENATSQNRMINLESTVHKVSHADKKEGNSKDRNMVCKFCSFSHRMKKEECPAYGRTCLGCNGRTIFDVAALLVVQMHIATFTHARKD